MYIPICIVIPYRRAYVLPFVYHVFICFSDEALLLDLLSLWLAVRRFRAFVFVSLALLY